MFAINILFQLKNLLNRNRDDKMINNKLIINIRMFCKGATRNV